MRNAIVIVLLGTLAWFGYQKYKTAAEQPVVDASTSASLSAPQAAPAAATSQFSCDGRTHCSQMRSCAEAKYFIQHCPDTKMDGNNDGVPCERQWCR